MTDKPTGIDRLYEEMAYFAALLIWLIEHKSDNEADEEIGSILENRPYFRGLVYDVLKSCQK